MVISRVLKSFEIILLTVQCLKRGLLPLSLDHHGLVVVAPGEVENQVIAKLLSEGLSEWSNYLLENISSLRNKG